MLMAGHKVFSGGPFKSHERVECPEQVSSELDEDERVERSPFLFARGRILASSSGMSRRDNYYVYILKCFDGTLYVGHTKNLKKRLFWHNSGFASQHTSNRLPVKLVYSEEHPEEISAMQREVQLKRWSGAKKLALISGGLETLRNLSKSRE